MDCSLNEINCKRTLIWKTYNEEIETKIQKNDNNFEETKITSNFPITYSPEELQSWKPPGIGVCHKPPINAIKHELKPILIQ